jgi:hypothetical protein
MKNGSFPEALPRGWSNAICKANGTTPSAKQMGSDETRSAKQKGLVKNPICKAYRA